MSQNKLDSVEMYFLRAQENYQQLRCTASDKVYLFKMWSGLYYRKNDYSKSLDYSLKLLKASEDSENVYEQANVHTMIAQLFNQMNQADKGIVYARKAVPLMQLVEDDGKKADLLFKLGKRYLWHYQDFGYQPSLDSFEIFSVQHLTVARRLGNKAELGKAYSNLQGVAYERKNYKRAIQYLDSSLLYVNAANLSNRAVNYYDLADLYLLDNDYTKAQQWADSAMSIYKVLGDVAYVSETYRLLANIHRAAGDYKAALMAFERGDHLRDSITDLEKSEALNELEKKYSQEKNEQTIRDLSQQRLVYLLLVLITVMVAVVIWVFLRQKNIKQRQAILETEQRLNRARMNPHFFFNALASLQQYALREGDGLKLASNLSKFSHVMRRTLDSTYQELSTVEAEIDFLNQYLSIQQIRFPESFSYSVSASNKIEISEQLLPAMLVQPFVENSIEHGFSGVKGGQLLVTFEERGGELLVLIEDNGKGLRNAGEAKDYLSRATQIIKDRLYLLNLKQKSNARFTIEPISVGVRVEIYLPIRYS